MVRRVLATLLAVLLAALLTASPASAVTSAVVQNVDASEYPRIVFTLLVSPDAAVVPGDVPEVGVVENGTELGDVTVSALDTQHTPIDVVLLMDASGSMKGQPLADAQVAARRFVESMHGDDRIAIVAFSTEPRVLQGFTSDRAALFSAIDGLSASGETALYDGLVQAAGILAPSASPERYIVALSDGGDTFSLNPADNAARAVVEAKASVYAIALESPEYNPATLETIANVSGGRMTTVAASSSLGDVYQSIAEEMQLRYRVECTGTRPNTPELDLRVTVGSGDAAVTTGVSVPNPDFVATADVPATLRLGSASAPALVAALVTLFLAAVLLVLGVHLVLRKDKAALEQLHFYDQLQSTASPEFVETADGSGAALVNVLGDLAERRGFTGAVQGALESAGSSLRANEYIFFHLLATIVAGFAAELLSGGSFAWTALAVLLAVAVPLLVLRMRAAKRLRAFNDQVPDILDLIAGSLRSGWGIQQSIDLVVNEVGEPARSEFRRTQAEARLGLPLEQALNRMAERIGSDDLRWVVAAITIQREVGGNLAEVLNTVSRTIRGRAELRRQISALTAEGRLSLMILAVLPFLVFAGLWLVNPQYMMLAVRAPLGLGAFAMGAVLLVVGIFWLNRVMRIEV